MKNLSLSLIVLLFIGGQTFGQNRISTWDKDKITNIKIEIQENGSIIESAFFSEQKQINKIFDFLESIDFEETKDADVKNQFTVEDWTTRFIFRGHRDWVMFYENTATIGKTSFHINKNLNSEAKKLMEALDKN